MTSIATVFHFLPRSTKIINYLKKPKGLFSIVNIFTHRIPLTGMVYDEGRRGDQGKI